MKRIVNLFGLALILSTVFTGIFSTNSYAVLPPEYYEEQEPTADAHIVGKIINYEIKDREDETNSWDGEIYFDVEVEKTYKGCVKPGSVITLSESCRVIIEMENSIDGKTSTESAECLGSPHKIGDEYELYMNKQVEKTIDPCINPPCPLSEKITYVNAFSYGATIKNIDFSNANNNYINLSTWHTLTAVIIPLLGILLIIVLWLIIRKKHKNTKNSTKEQAISLAMKTEIKTNKKQINTIAFALTCVWSLSYVFITLVKNMDFSYENSLSISYLIIVVNILLIFIVSLFIKKRKLNTKGIYKKYIVYFLIAFFIIFFAISSLTMLIENSAHEPSLFATDYSIFSNLFHMIVPFGIIFNHPNYPSALDLFVLVLLSYCISHKVLKR